MKRKRFSIEQIVAVLKQADPARITQAVINTVCFHGKSPTGRLPKLEGQITIKE
ncbi:hypothetical protein BPA30113_00780 [Burkholderia paludis]|uniref:Transposase n=1 Tax=Burkholderia paludis TaxID=1506587 RepID=A0A6J5CV78_9BURK|nr:hypothetical protein LMG30113_00095 [Burkholderia paludis]VWB22920.1 hypothetical protein BPA30113_00780 [Burkholderia paludis]